MLTQPDPALLAAIGQHLNDTRATVHTMEAGTLFEYRRDQFGVLKRKPLEPEAQS